MPAEKQPTASIRVDPALRDMLKIICAHSKDVFGHLIKATEYVDPLIRKAIERDYDKVLAHLQKKKRKPASEP